MADFFKRSNFRIMILIFNSFRTLSTLSTVYRLSSLVLGSEDHRLKLLFTYLLARSQLIGKVGQGLDVWVMKWSLYEHICFSKIRSKFLCSSLDLFRCAGEIWVGRNGSSLNIHFGGAALTFTNYICSDLYSDEFSI